MAYVPPHKRHLRDSGKPSPTPDSLIPQFNRNLNSSSSSSSKFHMKKSSQAGKIIYADDSIHRWFSVGLADDSQFPSATCLSPFTSESIERKSGEKLLVLDLSDHLKSETEGVKLKSPWVLVAENILQDLLKAFEKVKNEMMGHKFVDVKPTLIARFGRVLFHRGPSVSPESEDEGSFTEATLLKMKRLFYTNLSSSYMDYILTEAVPRIGISFEEEKELYHVKLSDNTRPDSTISCKCSIGRDSKSLELYKIELNQVRHLVADMSCLGQKMDLRLMLNTKRTISVLSDEEMDAIRSLIRSAVLDSDVKGGLRWSLGKDFSGNQYTVCGVWHTTAKTFSNSSIRLKVRHADRFDFRTSAGEATREVSLKMIGVVSELQQNRVEVEHISKMLKDQLRLIWESFLSHN